MLSVGLGLLVWVALGVVVGVGVGLAESLGGKRECLGLLKRRRQ